MTQFEKKELKKRSQNLSDWYTDVVLKAELADYGPAKGTMIIRPYGFAIWEQVQEIFNKWIKDYGVENAYFPLFIPMSLMQKEQDHVKGFSPELAVVTYGGGKRLTEPLVVRPTSETIMYHMYSKWISSHRDLPMLINQWNNVVRWELRTYLFLRTTEFLWQEGHTAHATEKDAIKMQEQALEWYHKIYEDYFAIPVIKGAKSESEKFAGAKTTYAVEALMPDGKALQAATSHNLGQNFAKVFDITFQDAKSKTQYVWQTSWGLSTRALGGLFLTHGDDDGLLMPPKIAPIQVVIIPIELNDSILEFSQKIKDQLEKAKIRAKLDNRDNQSVGRKFNEWELKGVPLRLEIGNWEYQNNRVKCVQRFSRIDDNLPIVDLDKQIKSKLDTIQKALFEKARRNLQAKTFSTNTYGEFKKVMSESRGLIKVFWKEDTASEEKIKTETKATPRVRILKNKQKGKCFITGEETTELWYFAQSY